MNMDQFHPINNRTVKFVVSCCVRPIARICRRGVIWVSDLYVCVHKHARLGGSGGMLPQEIFRN